MLAKLWANLLMHLFMCLFAHHKCASISMSKLRFSRTDRCVFRRDIESNFFMILQSLSLKHGKFYNKLFILQTYKRKTLKLMWMHNN